MRKLEKLRNMNGKIAVITGATGHLGFAICTALAELGANLILLDKNNNNLVKVKVDIEETWDIKCITIECDLEVENQRKQAIKKITQNFKNIDCLINNAAFVGDSDLTGWAVPFPKQSTDTWRKAMEVNLTAPFHFSRDLFGKRKTKNSGVIVNISSIYASLGPDWNLYEGTLMGNPSAYSASKAGLEQLTRWLATTLAPHTRVNAIAPGGILRNQPQDFINRYVQKTPMERMASEEDFKGAIEFLCSDLSKYMTGQVLIIDGGISIK